MSFSIQFDCGGEDGQSCRGSIFLSDWETFYALTSHFSKQQYQAQWQEAVRLVLTERRTAALIKSIEIEADGTGILWLYPIVPSELAGDTESKMARLRNFPDIDDAGVYVGERFLHITVELSNFERRIFSRNEDGSTGEELALYYFDLSAPERIYGYLDENIADVSHWFFSNSDLKSFLMSKDQL